MVVLEFNTILSVLFRWMQLRESVDYMQVHVSSHARREAESTAADGINMAKAMEF